MGRDAWDDMSSRILQTRRPNGTNITVIIDADVVMQAFVVHFSGFYASIYYANFPSSYLSAIRHEGISALPSRFPTPLTLHHTAPANLLNADSRLGFIKNFIAVVRCLADGGAPIGYLRRDGGKIHRTGEESEGEEHMTSSQECLDERGIAEWRKDKAIAYAL